MVTTIRLLIVEDVADDAELLILALERDGFKLDWHRVDDAKSLTMALQTSVWDLVLSDFYMPGFSGLDALYLVRKHDALLPFIIVSGEIGEEMAVECLKKGAQNYILKHNLLRLPIVIRKELEESAIKRQAQIDARLLRESNKRLQLIYNSTHDMMMLIRVDPEHFFVETVNNALVTFFEDLYDTAKNIAFAEMPIMQFFQRWLKLNHHQIRITLERYQQVITKRESRKDTIKLLLKQELMYAEITLTPVISNGKCTHILSVTRDVTSTVKSAKKLKQSIEEVNRLKNLLEQENHYLKSEIKLDHGYNQLIFKSERFGKIMDQVQQVAPVDASVLIVGETGTGKELIARSIHELSHRKEKPLVKINCAALPHDLIESELFGHEKGAFTGAVQKKMGLFELAQDGTIFLDEIGELPLDLQPKLLRVLQEGELKRLGGTETIQLDVRVIAATNRNLQEAIQKKNFREDLFYRLNVFPINIPPLRERKQDIAPLVSFFINKYSRKFNKKVAPSIPMATLSLLENYDWPGNVRELENMVERALILSREDQLPFAQLLGVSENNQVDEPEMKLTSLKAIERQHILRVLEACKWKINGASGAAKQLDLPPTTLRDKMRKLHITRPPDKRRSGR